MAGARRVIDRRYLRLGILVALCATGSGAAAQQLATQPAAATRPATSQAASRPAAPVRRAAAEARRWIARPQREEVVDSHSPAARIVVRTYTEPKPLRVWLVTIDLVAEGVRATVTPPAAGLAGEEARFETRCENTLEFAQRTGVQLAVNTSAFAPFRPRAGMPMDVVGEAAADGVAYSPPQANHDAMYVSSAGRIALRRGPRAPAATQPAASARSQPAEAWHVIPGFRMLLDDGRLVVRQKEADSSFGGVNPRTAVATDRTGSTLWIAVVDGRQPGVSAGMTLIELAVLFESLGAWDALNLDGGGSTTLVLQQPDGTHRVLNVPVGQKAPGSLRQVANNLGFFLPPRVP
jgi:hypothetical protein